MGVAIPHLVTDLDITIEAAQWLTTAFLLTMAVVIPITGFLLQRFATRPIFIAAMTLFSAGTLIAALAPGFEVLLLARVVQASGTAIMMPPAHDDAHDARRAGRRGAVHGPRLDRDLGRSGDRADDLGPHPHRTVVAVHVLARPADRPRHARHRHPPRRERQRAARHPHRRVLGDAVGVRVRRARLRPRARRRRGGGHRRPGADVDLVRGRRHRHRDVHPPRAGLQGTTVRCSTSAPSGRRTSRSRSGSWSS